MLRPESPTLLQLRELRANLKSRGVLKAVDERLARLIPEVAENVSSREKIVKDGVWGTISVPGRFVPILDTRLLQRQRRIRQLGLSYLVYPAVGYSRLEHALGCFHAMDLLLSSVTARSDAGVSAQLDLRRRDQLLLGALLHDVGHMPFSHASERTLEMMADDLMIGPLSASQVRDDVSDAVDKSLRLADVISLLVLMSDRVMGFLRHLVPAAEQAAPEDFFLEISAFIAGARLGDADLACAQILSGPVDADKIDYMSRDALVSGVPVSVDISRLLARCSFESVPVQNLPQSMQQKATSNTATIFVTDIAGTNALEELTISRFILYDRIYNHHKTKAAESLLHELLAEAFNSGLLPRNVLEFWTMNDESLLHAAIGNPATRVLAEKLLYRELPKRAFVFAQRHIAHPVQPYKEPTDSSGAEGSRVHSAQITAAMGPLLDAIDEAFRVDERRKQLQNDIKKRATDLAEVLDEASYRPKRALQVVTMCPRPSSPFGVSGEALVIDLDRKVTMFQKHMPLEQWAAAFSLNKRFGYIFTDPEWTSIVRIAAELVLWEQFSQKIGAVEVRPKLVDSAQTQAKLQGSQISRIKELLDKKNAFDQAWPLRPLSSTSTPTRLRTIAQRFAQFQGAGGWQVSEESVSNFVRQFPMRLQDSICNLLEKTTFLDRTALTVGVGNVLKRVLSQLGSSSAQVVGLSPNSGAQVRMLTEADLRAELGARCKFSHENIETAIQNADALLLVDDLLSSGSQASVQLQAWLGVPRADWLDPKEQNVSEKALSPASIEKFKKLPVRLVFARATKLGSQKIKESAVTLGFADLSVDYEREIGQAPTLDGTDAELRSYLESTGAALLIGVYGSDKAEEGRRNALGYGGITALLVSTFNVPTCCPAALWCPGTVHNAPWVPLFIRRGYQQRAIFV